jgi:deazaflavin-dependent oxidoreductase (nitroreductase family)
VSLRVKTLSAIHRAIYSASGRRIGNRIAGMPVLLLTTVGRRTGKQRTVPLTFIEEDGGLVLVASYGGRPHNPAWFENLIVNPQVDVRIGNEVRTLTARGATPDERARLWPRVVVLGDAVLAWRTGHDTEQQIARERHEASRRHRRLLSALAAGAILVVVMAGVTVFALTQRSEARAQANKAQARTLEGEALSLFETDPELSLILASEAARKSPSPQVERTLRNAYILSRERAVFPTRGAVSAAMYSPDGKFVVVASKDGSTRVFDARTQKRVLSVNHGAPVTSADLSSDDTRLVTAGEDGRARIWDAVTGKRLGSVRHGSPVRTAAFDPAGSLVVTTGDRVAKIWNAHGQPVAVLPWDKPVTAAAFSPGGLVVVVGNESIARVYDASTGRLVRSLDQGGRVTSAKFSLGGDLLMTTGANETARIWRVRDGKLLRELKGHRGAVLDAAFSPGGWRVATASADGTGRIWDVRTGGTVASILGHGGIVDAVAFSPDGNFVVTGSTDGTARVSKADNGSGRVVLAGHDDSVHTVAFSPDGSRVLTVSDDGTARLWDPAAQTHLGLVRRARGPLEDAEYVGKGGRILVAGPGRQALVLRAADGRVVESIPARGPVTAVAASPDGSLLAIAGGRVLLLRHQDGRTTKLVHPDKVTSVAFSPDGGRVVTGGRRGTARIWSVDGKQLVQLRGHTGEITDVAFSPDGNRVATSSRDAIARTWDATTGTSLQSFTGHRDDVNSVAFSADGRLLLTASRDHDGRLWDVETGTVKQVLRAHYGEVADASFSPDGRWILTAGPAAAYLWQQGVRAPVLAPGFGGHQSRLTSAMFDPSSRFVLTASADGTVRRAECLVCRDLDGMLDLARLQLAEIGRTLTQAERERYGLD